MDSDNRYPRALSRSKKVTSSFETLKMLIALVTEQILDIKKGEGEKRERRRVAMEKQLGKTTK